MIGKLTELLSRISPPAPGSLPSVYLDFSSVAQRYSTVALRIRNKSDNAVLVDKLEFIGADGGQTVDVSGTVVGGAQTLSTPVQPHAAGVLDLKGTSFRQVIQVAGYRGIVKGKIRGHVSGADTDILWSPPLTIDFAKQTVSYKHAGQKGSR
ncbi:MAG TPA: hypothetical protein VGK19_26340 [Capsulimonadaceae bacterium]|jgi:hypothetical protein